MAEVSRSFHDNIEVVWTAVKTAIYSALDKHVPTKLTSTRYTHPWVNTNLRRLVRRKQRAHIKAAQRLRPVKKATDRGIEVNKKSQHILYARCYQCFWYCTPGKQRLQSNTTAKAEILNEQFHSVYTQHF